jgi:hypothetical protein
VAAVFGCGFQPGDEITSEVICIFIGVTGGAAAALNEGAEHGSPSAR